MSQPTITVIVPRKGIARGKSTVEVKAEGFVGTACTLATAFLNNIGQVQRDVASAEMYEVEEEKQKIDYGNGG